MRHRQQRVIDLWSLQIFYMSLIRRLALPIAWMLSVLLYGIARPRAIAQESPLAIPHVVHVIGLGDLKPKVVGELDIDSRNLIFTAAGAKTGIPIRSIVGFTTEHDTVPLIKGATGKVVGMAPYGVGPAINMVRDAVDTLTLVYRDPNHAIHGTVMLLPKGQGQAVTMSLALSGVLPRDYSRITAVETAKPLMAQQRREDAAFLHPMPIIKIALLTTSADGVPAEFPIGIYEELIAELRTTGMFQEVWRAGDDRADRNALLLSIDIQEFKKGNERTRSLIPYWGSTVIKAQVQLKNSAQQVLLERQMSAAVHFRGEDAGADHDFCKRIEKALKKLPELQSKDTDR